MSLEPITAKKRGRPIVGESTKERRIISPKTAVTASLIFVLVALVGYGQYEIHRLKDPAYQQVLADKRTDDILYEVGQVMILPEGRPQIATITDAEVAKKGQVFFINAKNGDRVLVYEKEAILYRPSENKIVNVAPVGGDTPAQSTVPVAAAGDKADPISEDTQHE